MKKDLQIVLIELDIIWENPIANHTLLEVEFGKYPDCDLIVLPEMFTTGFTQNIAVAQKIDGLSMQFLKKWATQLQCAIAGSLLIEENNRFYNRFVFVYPDGKLEYYDKNHLFTFANEHEKIEPGKNQKIINYLGWKINLLVCYDLRFPVWCRNTPENFYDLTLIVANWPQTRIFAWETLLTARAIENQSYFIGVNRIGKDGKNLIYNGNSKVMNALGENINKQNNCYVLSYENLKKTRQDFPFLKDQNQFKLLNNTE
jgi:omega-amidase